MKILKNSIAAISLYFLFFSFAGAQVSINEIMYDLDGTDTGREWLEIYNSGESTDLSAWKFFEADTNHGLVPYQGGSVLPQGGYAVISDNPGKFLSDWPSYQGIIFDSSFSLGNDPGETLSLKDSSLNIVDSVGYQKSWGASGDGLSLQKQGSNWIAGTPTPGEANGSSTAPPPSVTENPVPKPSPASSSQISSSGLEVKITMIGQPIVKVPVSLRSEIRKSDGTTIKEGKYFWNFGDGVAVEENIGIVEHTYDYPGEYVVVLDYFSNSSSQTPDSSARLTAKAEEAKITISGAGEDGHVELSNGGKSEINLGGWRLESGDKKFPIAQNTFIQAGKKIIFSSEVTKFSGAESKAASLFFPNGLLASSYAGQSTEEEAPTPSVLTEEKKETPPPLPKRTEETNLKDKDVLSDKVSLEASALSSGALSDKDTYIWMLGLFGIIVAGIISALVLLRERRKNPSSVADKIRIIE